MNTYLVIVEVSQKQAYIFASNKLRDNIKNSAIIAYVTSDAYFKDCTRGVQANGKNLYDEEENLVYSGGGHAILEFSHENSAKKFIHLVTSAALMKYPGLELFATIRECQGEPNAESISKLRGDLEKKKSLRRASFSQGTFGVEAINPSTRDVVLLNAGGGEKEAKVLTDVVSKDSELYPDGYALAVSFEDLGGNRDESNFIAVVHIDGNGMGKRLEALGGEDLDLSWDEYRFYMKCFSESIADDFKDAFSKMCDCVVANIKEGKIGDITLKQNEEGKYYLPIRLVIDEGDDICFVTEGRIGIECARIFLETVNRKVNTVDDKSYPACAGVAIVHQKYPFYRAYELAEMLCSNAKKFVANSIQEYKIKNENTQNNSDIFPDLCAIDWHLEFGEMGEGMDDIRKNYITAEGKHMELRPYVVCGSEPLMRFEILRDYKNFRSVMDIVGNKANVYARGKLKGLRDVMRKSEDEAWNYLEVNRIKEIAMRCYTGIYKEIDYSRLFTGEGQDKGLFVQTTDGKERSILFDAIELSDTFIPLNDLGGEL